MSLKQRKQGRSSEESKVAQARKQDCSSEETRSLRRCAPNGGMVVW